MEFLVLPVLFAGMTFIMTVVMKKGMGKTNHPKAVETSVGSLNAHKKERREGERKKWLVDFRLAQEDALVQQTGLSYTQFKEYVDIVSRFFVATGRIKDAEQSNKPHDESMVDEYTCRTFGGVASTYKISNCPCYTCVTEEFVQRATQLSKSAEPYEIQIRQKANPTFEGIAHFYSDQEPDSCLDKEPAELVSSYKEVFNDE